MKKLFALAVGVSLALSVQTLWAQAPVRGEITPPVITQDENPLKALFAAIELAGNSNDPHDVKRVYHFNDKNEEARFEAAFQAHDLSLKYGSPYTLNVERSLGNYFYDGGKRMILFVEKEIAGATGNAQVTDATYFVNIDGKWRLDWAAEARYHQYENLSDSATTATYRGEINNRLAELETNFNGQRLMPILNQVHFSAKEGSPEFVEQYGQLGKIIAERLKAVREADREFTLRASDITFSDDRAFFTLTVTFKREDREAPTAEDQLTLKRSMIRKEGEWFFTPQFFTEI